MTSKAVPFALFHLEIEFAEKNSTVLPEQIRSVSKKRVKGYLGEVSKEIMRKISKLLHIICDLEE